MVEFVIDGGTVQYTDPGGVTHTETMTNRIKIIEGRGSPQYTNINFACHSNDPAGNHGIVFGEENGIKGNGNAYGKTIAQIHREGTVDTIKRQWLIDKGMPETATAGNTYTLNDGSKVKLSASYSPSETFAKIDSYEIDTGKFRYANGKITYETSAGSVIETDGTVNGGKEVRTTATDGNLKATKSGDNIDLEWTKEGCEPRQYTSTDTKKGIHEKIKSDGKINEVKVDGVGRGAPMAWKRLS